MVKSRKLDNIKLKGKKIFSQVRFSCFTMYLNVCSMIFESVLKACLSSQNARKRVHLSEVMRFESCIYQLRCVNCIKVMKISCKIIKVSHIIDSFHCFIKLLCLMAGGFGLNFHYLLLNNLHWD